MMRSRAVREGSVGLFALLGLAIFGGLAIWLRGGGFGQRTYQFIAEFPDVSGLQIGAPVRYRGVTVGKIATMTPGNNGVDVAIEISSSDIILPDKVIIQTNRYGLIGEASIDITPVGSLPGDVQSFNPLGEDCNSQVIICEGDRLTGDPGVQLFENFARFSALYTDPKFFNSILAAAQNTSEAADRIARLSDVISRLSNTLNKEIQGVSDTTDAVTQTADQTSQLIGNINRLVSSNQSNLEKTVTTTSELTTNLNSLIKENRGNLNRTLGSIDETNQELRTLVSSLQTTVNQVNSGLEASDTKKIAQNLNTLVNNAATASENLRQLSQTLNDPANAVSLQRTLDSARATFENAQKITADLDDLTGDPAFRSNLRDLVNGLSTLVSSSERLEQQIQTAQALNLVAQQLHSIDTPVRLQPYHSTVSNKTATPQTQLPYLNFIPENFSRSFKYPNLSSDRLSKKPLPHPASFELQDALSSSQFKIPNSK
jgi:phospholipid/cholesterol/gamma-HCH transport system substrate-binding protein